VLPVGAVLLAAPVAGGAAAGPAGVAAVPVGPVGAATDPVADGGLTSLAPPAAGRAGTLTSM